ncbi:SDR family oxidoreductase [Schumannella soli]|nr:SDR family oxidoreductase [Schumannella soli]
MSPSDRSASTSSLPELAVTGVTGRVGGMVARELAADGIPLRLLARRPEAAPQLDDATVVAAEYADDDRARTALAGVRTLFLVSGAESADRLAQHFAVIDAAAAAGVEHVVYTSFFGAADDATFTLARDHAATERHLQASGMAHTFLRDDFYLDFFAHLPGDDGVIRGPAGSGRVAAVAQADVARTAAAILRDPAAHAGATYDLTGPEALTLDEVAGILSASTGRAIAFHDETLDEAYASRASYGAPDWQVEAWVSTYTAIAAGELDGVTDAVERVTGRAPLSLRELMAG